MTQDPVFALPDLPPDLNTCIPAADKHHQHATWARTFHSRPSHMFYPESIAHVQAILVQARREHKRVCAVGSAHSPSDLTCTSAYLISMREMGSILHTHVKRGDDGTVLGGSMLVQAGVSLNKLNSFAAAHGLTLPNIGSIDEQSLAGAISTATHGSGLKHGLLSQHVKGLRIVLGDARAIYCSKSKNVDLFRAALVSLGALGIITEIEYALVPDRKLAWTQELLTFEVFLNRWEQGRLWERAEFVRAWWLPYSRKINLWSARQSDEEMKRPKTRWYDPILRESYQAFLWLATYFPKLNPWIERTMWGLQTRFTPGPGLIATGVAPQREALTLDCLYSQFVNEWALPLSKGLEALRRLDAWIAHDAASSKIPFSSNDVWVHSPIEIRVTDGTSATTNIRGFLDPTNPREPTLYLNAILYRPYGVDPPYWKRYYVAFEWLMSQLGGRPHWGKCFQTVKASQTHLMYDQDGSNMKKYLQVRNSVDPDGMFVGGWHRRVLLNHSASPHLTLEEHEINRVERSSGGALWQGARATKPRVYDMDFEKQMRTAISEESFDSLGASTESAEEILRDEVIQFVPGDRS